MKNANFAALWSHNDTPTQRCFPQVSPLAWRLRSAFQSNWVRFYALPEGNRSAVAPIQNQEVLNRFGEIGAALFKTPSECISIVSPLRKFEGGYGRYKPDIVERLGLALVQSNFIDDQEDDGFTFDLYGGSTTFDDKRIAELVTEIMQDAIMQSVIISDPGDIIAPYDGGFDVIANNIHDVSRLRAAFPDWLSTHVEGF